MLNYTAIDFETANSCRASACAVGFVRVRDGIPVAEGHRFMRPHESVDHFDRGLSELHGIFPEHVADEPSWREMLPRFIDFIGDDVVVAHCASFDVQVIQEACKAEGIAWPEIRYLCTRDIARSLVPDLPNFELPTVLEALGEEMINHHYALADARAAVLVVSGLAQLANAVDLQDLASSAGVPIRHLQAGRHDGDYAPTIGKGRPAYVTRPPLSFPEANPHADPTGPLYGQVVVFTGDLITMSRQQAVDECARVGGLPKDRPPNKRTNILVVGQVNPATLAAGATITSSERRALELFEQGHDIKFMTEDEFLRCLEAPESSQSGIA